MKKSFLGLSLLCLLALFTLSACSTAHEHTLVKTAAKESTCTESGNRAYFTCTDCGKFFTDEAGTAETTIKEQTIAPLTHDWGEVSYTINNEKTECTATRTCGRDTSHTESETASMTKDGLVYLASFENDAFADYVYSTAHEHALAKTDATAATCTESGNRAYFTCTDCGKLFTDEAGTAETTIKEQTIAPLTHDWGDVCYTINDEKTECTATRVCGRDASHTESETANVIKEGFVYQASFENDAFADYRKDATPRITAVEFANTDSACYDAVTKTFTVDIHGGDLPVFKVLGENLEEIYGSEAWTYYFQFKDNLGIDLSKNALTFAAGSATYALGEVSRRSLSTNPYEIVFTNDGESFTSTGYYIRLAVNENAKIDSMSFNSDSPAYDAASATFTVSDETPLVIAFTGTDICGANTIHVLMGSVTYGSSTYTIQDSADGFTVVDADTVIWTITPSLLRPLLELIPEVNLLGYTNDGATFGDYILLTLILAD